MATQSSTASTDTSQETVVLLTRAATGQVKASLIFDCVIEETHTETSTATDHPVEEGENIVDHVRPEPTQLSAHVVISNTPPFGDADQSGTVDYTLSGQSANRKVTFQSSAMGGQDLSRGSKLWDQVNNLRLAGTMLTLATSLKRYTSFVIVTLSTTRNAQNSDGVEFTIGFKHISVVKNKQTQAKVSNDKKVTKKVKDGAKAPTEIPKTAAAAGFDGGVSLGKSVGILH